MKSKFRLIVGVLMLLGSVFISEEYPSIIFLTIVVSSMVIISELMKNNKEKVW